MVPAFIALSVAPNLLFAGSVLLVTASCKEAMELVNRL